MSTDPTAVPATRCCDPALAGTAGCCSTPTASTPVALPLSIPGDAPGDVRTIVREKYGQIAESGSCGCGAGGCCGGSDTDGVLAEIGYSANDVAAIPDGANLGLGCGNPLAFANAQPGETVLDLGSGAGIDCFLAARAVGAGGRVIGVDMTHAMLEKARRNAATHGFTNVEFRLGEIEHLPVADASVDLIISNCVVNLSPDKAAVGALPAAPTRESWPGCC